MNSIIENWQREFYPSDENDTAARGEKALRLRSFYEALAGQLYYQYEPTKRSSNRVNRDFLLRLESWLSKFESDEDRWIAFQSVEYIFFAGQQEFEELYRCAYEHAILPWLVNNADLDIFSSEINITLRKELACCWPCPITDSLRINGFLHITGMRGKELRPDWYSLRKLGEKEKIQKYTQEQGVKYLILIEDFVGSGSQICRALTFATNTFNGPILLIPLIICAPGDRMIKRHIKRLECKNVSYQPQVIIEDSCLVSQQPHEDEPRLFSKIRNILQKTYPLILNKETKLEDGEEFGYKKTGSLVVLYSNCPNNTPPIFHKSAKSWHPPFPRSARV